MDKIDRLIINKMQMGFPVCDRPYAVMGNQLGITEADLMDRIQSLIDDGTLSRFGPLYNVEKMGGVYSLVAMRVPDDDLERVVQIVNGHQEVAHHYERTHEFNLWFVIAIEDKSEMSSLLARLEERTGYRIYNFPKLEEYYVGARFNA